MFQTLKPRDQLEGSGMALVKKYIEHFVGAIMLKSKEGKGCRFCFTWRNKTSKPCGENGR